MGQRLITDKEARDQIRLLCQMAGGVGKLAKKVGVSCASVSQQANGHRPIQGRLAEYMGLKVERKVELFYRSIDKE